MDNPDEGNIPESDLRDASKGSLGFNIRICDSQVGLFTAFAGSV